MASTLVLVPTYNEAENITSILTRLFKANPAVDALVIDDNSPDRTAEIVRDLASQDARINLLNRPEKQGLGPAYLAGFRWAMDHGYDRVVEMDADGSHLPEQLPRLLGASRGSRQPDLVIGARWIDGGEVPGWALHRKWLSQLANFYIQAVLRLRCHDATGGYRVYRVDTLRNLPLDTVKSAGYAFQIEMTRLVRQYGGEIMEVPITFVERNAGQSKMSPYIIVEALGEVTWWAIQDSIKL